MFVHACSINHYRSIGVWARHIKDMKKPVEDRYIRSIVTTPDDGILIVTCEKYLLNLVHEAIAIQVDTTFKRVVGGLNEWELVIWFAGAER